MDKLITPFGEIDIQIDGQSVPYTAQKGDALEVLCPDVLGRYRITVHFKPDGKEHSIACVFMPTCEYESSSEPGESLTCQSFYGDNRIKMSIGAEYEGGYYLDGRRVSDEYDYDAETWANGVSYLTLADTSTEEYVFGIAWIDDAGWDDPPDYRNEREVQTWYGADPTISL